MAYGYTFAWYGGYIQLLHLRARWFSPQDGIFLSRDPVESEPPYLYVRGNPVSRVDPSGLCAELYDEECWRTYNEIITLCPECASMKRPNPDPLSSNRFIRLDEENTSYLQRVLNDVRDGWSPFDGWNFFDPLAPKLWKLSKREAQRFRLPVELVAGTVAVEIVNDTNIFDIAGDLALMLLVQDHFMGGCVSTSLLEVWEKSRKGPSGEVIGPGAGVGGVHTATAIEIENYYAENGLGDYLPSPPDKYWRMKTLAEDEVNIRYIAAYLKQLADIRKDTSAAILGSNSSIVTSHLTDLNDIDMQIIYGAYRAGINVGYGGVEMYQRWPAPRPESFGSEIAPYLPFYRQKALRE